jgi:hypothetical protein
MALPGIEVGSVIYRLNAISPLIRDPTLNLHFKLASKRIDVNKSHRITILDVSDRTGFLISALSSIVYRRRVSGRDFLSGTVSRK